MKVFPSSIGRMMGGEEQESHVSQQESQLTVGGNIWKYLVLNAGLVLFTRPAW